MGQRGEVACSTPRKPSLPARGSAWTPRTATCTVLFALFVLSVPVLSGTTSAGPGERDGSATMALLSTPALQTKEARSLGIDTIDEIRALDTRNLFEQASLACQQGQNAKGYVMFRLFSERVPNFVEGYTNAAVALERMSRNEQAKTLYRETLKRFPGNEKVILSLVNVLQHEAVKAFSDENFRRALANYNEIVSLKPDIPDAHVNVGAIQERLGKFPEAKKAYKKAIKLAPKTVGGYNALCRLLMYMVSSHNYRALGIDHLQRQELFEEAKLACSTAVAISPDDPTANMNLGLVFKESLEFDSAVMHLTRALRGQPDDPVILTNLAAALSRQGNVPAALEHQQRVVELTKSPSAMNTLGTMAAPYDRHSQIGKDGHWQGMEQHLKALGEFRLCKSWPESHHVTIDVLYEPATEMLGWEHARALAGPTDVPVHFRDKQTVLVTLEECHLEGAAGIPSINGDVVAWLGPTTEIVRDFTGAGQRTVFVEEPAVALVHQVGHNYYHWTIELLTRLIISYDHLWGPDGSNQDVRLVVAALDQHEWFRDAVEFFGFELPNAPIDYSPNTETRYAFAQLLWVDWLQLDTEDPEQNDLWSGYLPSAHAVRRLNAVATAQYAKRGLPGMPTARVVYVHRSGVRQVNDQEILTDLLARMLGDNFVVFSTEHSDKPLGLQQQISHFYNASIIMGPHGAGLTNMVFCGNQEAAVVEFGMEPVSNRCFAFLAAALELDYWLVPEVSCFYHRKYDMTESKAHAVARYILAILDEKDLGHLVADGFDRADVLPRDEL